MKMFSNERNINCFKVSSYIFILFIVINAAGNLAEPISDSSRQHLLNTKSRFGSVSSPFFYLCHNPGRPGEPIDLGADDVKLSLETIGNKKLDSGYKPRSAYELMISANIQMDGFLLTGVHALTKGFMESKHIPSSSTRNINSAGMICSILNSHISKRPKSKFPLVWMAPPKGTGCVVFLATGSLQDQMLFKDFTIAEICEEEIIGKLRISMPHLTSLQTDGLVFKDDFQNRALNSEIWDTLNDGEISSNNSSQSRLSVSLNKKTSFLQSVPMDFSRAQHVQYTLRGGNCNSGSEVHIMLGIADIAEDTSMIESLSAVQNMKEEGSGQIKDEQIGRADINPSFDDDIEAKAFTASVDQNDNPGDLLVEMLSTDFEHNTEGSGSGDLIMQADQPAMDMPTRCSHWETIVINQVSDINEVYSKSIPRKFKNKNVCIKWANLEDSQDEQCSTVDNVAVVTKDSHQGPIVDDFDPVDPSNWFFFPGGKIEEACGSDGNSLSFDGIQTENWVSTRHFDFSGASFQEDSILSKKFSSDQNNEGWQVESNEENCKEHYDGISLYGKDSLVCTPFVDGRIVRVIKFEGGISSCSEENEISLKILVELKGQKKFLSSVILKDELDSKTVVLNSTFQHEGIRICIQYNEHQSNEVPWILSRLDLLPWLPSNPEYFLQTQMNLKCSYTEVDIDIEVSSDGGLTWWSIHPRCLPADCRGKTSPIDDITSHGLDSGWTMITLPLPFVALSSNSRIRIRQLEPGNSIWRPSWAIDYLYIGKCLQGCNGHGICTTSLKCKCEYGYSGDACENSEIQYPLYISEPFTGKIENSANILETSGGASSYQCGIVGAGEAAVFKGRGLRFLTTIDLNTTDCHYLQFHFRSGTHSNVGKCPGPDDIDEAIYVHYSCTGGTSWHLLRTLNPFKHREPSHVSIPLPLKAKNSSCRFQIWQDKHSGVGKDIWAIDDVTVTSKMFNSIELSFEDPGKVNNSLRFHLGKLDNICGRETTMMFDQSSANNGLYRFMETKSITVGPSYMMQFDLAIGCDGISYTKDMNSTVVLEYSLNHGLTWKVVQDVCTPSTPGCEPYFTRGTIYHISEYNQWKRATIRLPKHTWSPTTRLRLRQIEISEIGVPWAVDNLYIGHQCSGLCSGHGYCTARGCRCDEEFHGYMCLPLHKLFTEVNADFDTAENLENYRFHVIGGAQVSGSEGCGTVVSQKSLHFGDPGIRHFETDDLNAENLHSISFYLVIGGNHGLQKMCLSAIIRADKNRENNIETLNYGSVVLEYSNDGGISWKLLREMIPSEYRTPSQFSMILGDETVEETKGNNDVIRFRIWQPKHDETDQWAVDNLIIKPLDPSITVQADFSEGSSIESPWLSVTKFTMNKYCGSDESTQVMDSKDPIRKAVTNVLSLHEGDIITFQISVGCTNIEEGSPVRFEFSRDGGNEWEILRKGCLPMSSDCKDPQEPSIYFPGHHGKWHRTLIPVDHRLIHGDAQLRWIQNNKNQISGNEFALKDLYIGPPCKFNCHGHGLCTAAGFCKCETGFSGKYCGQKKEENSPWLRENFESSSLTLKFWEDADGALVSAGCNDEHDDNVLLFSGDNHRFITTKELNTKDVKFLVFDLQIGADNRESRCRKAKSPEDDVILEYSINNGLTWTLLQHFEPEITTRRKQPFFILLPRKARTEHTKFRWWQTPPHMINEKNYDQAEWQLDNVMVLANETLSLNVSENFTTGIGDQWFLVNGAKSETVKCGNGDNPALIFSGHDFPRFAETWDFEASEMTILQFDIKPNCDSRKNSVDVQVELSINNGNTWNLFKEFCVPPSSKCDSFDLPSIYSSVAITNWTRVTLPFPKYVDGERLRIRFKQHVDKREVIDPTSSWAIDNIFIGSSCPWMCSGHGQCKDNKCICDDGFFGEFCVPEKILSCEILDKFNDGVSEEHLWSSVQGAEISTRCNAVVFDTALVFYKEGDRYVTTTDLDMTGGDFLQFSLLMGCKKVSKFSNSPQVKDSKEIYSSILVQYSITGGIIWHELKNIKFQPHFEPVFISVNLRDYPGLLSNSTRFRLWQPTHGGSLENVWAIDNFFVGGMLVYPNVLHEDFNEPTPVKDAWIDWPAGKLMPVCEIYEPRSALTIGQGEGEHSVQSRDLAIEQNSVIQFDIRVGCGEQTIANHNISLEYSTDYGLTFALLRTLKTLYEDTIDYSQELQTPSVYYVNAAPGWKRIVIPLNDLPICSNVRFRWIQGFYLPKEDSVVWALDNVYIGPACKKHCSGHGYCISGNLCDCDDNYEGSDHCSNSEQNDPKLIEDFDEESEMLKSWHWSGGEISSQCKVISGTSLLFWLQGERMLVTKDLDLSHGSVVQFYIRFDCTGQWISNPRLNNTKIILLQFSTDGGITWSLISEIFRQSESIEQLLETKFFTTDLPESSKTNATRLRWWEPSVDGKFYSQWAIDQIHIMSSSEGLPYFYDDGNGTEWLLRPGSKVEQACDFRRNGLHFSGNGIVRFAETPDIVISRSSFIQFEISIGCKEINHCFDIAVEYTANHGKTWNLVRQTCLPSDSRCPDFWFSSLMTSDIFSNLTQVTLKIPKRFRSSLMRFRFRQPSSNDSHHSWFVSRVYVGDGCSSMCSGRGFCIEGTCECSPGWIGQDCKDRLHDLPIFIADDFVGETNASLWDKIVGGKLSDLCGPIASGLALHFYGGCSRILETIDIDLREALFVQFNIMTGCLDTVTNASASGDNSIVVQTSCDSGINWRTLKRLSLIYHKPKYIWMELPPYARCFGGRVRWWQPGDEQKPNRFDWALDSVIVGGKSSPPFSLTLESPQDLTFPQWLRGYNTKPGKYCDWHNSTQVLESTPSEPAMIQTTDLQITVNHSIHFRLSLGCEALWDNSIEPVSLQYSRDHGRNWYLVRELCLPFNSTNCNDLHDASVFYAPQNSQYYVFPLDKIGPAKYMRFRWIQQETSDVMGTHKWSLTDVYIGYSCHLHCLGRGICIDEKCICNEGYSGTFCQNITSFNAPYIKDSFDSPEFLPHWQHIQGALLGPGCGGQLEEPPSVTFQGPHTRALKSRPIDTRSGRFVLFTAQIGSSHGRNICRKPNERFHNIFLQYSRNGGIKWNLLKELDYNLYRKPHEDYIILPQDAMTPATLFRFWQPYLDPSPPAWSLDNIFIGGSEIGASHLLENFDLEPTITEWLFAPHSKNEINYCERGDNGSMVWGADHPGQRAITTQELIINDGHVLQFKISVGCNQINADCNNGPEVILEFTKDRGFSDWEPVQDSCFPETSPDPDCFPYTFHGPSQFGSDAYSAWTRVTLVLPEKTWSSTTQFRWIQHGGNKGDQMERIPPWALDDVYIGQSCEQHCRGRGSCINGRCDCDIGYEGPTCESHSDNKIPLPTSLIDGFESGIESNWEVVTGGSIGMGCNSMAPYGHGKHLYFSGCGVRQAITKDMDTRKASKIMFVLRIGSHDGTKSCHVDLSNPKRIEDKGVVFQYSINNGVQWSTLDVHNPLDFRKARRVAYSLPEDAKLNGLKLRWWQPFHDGIGTDQWALDNLEIIQAQRKTTNKFSTKIFYHDEDL